MATTVGTVGRWHLLALLCLLSVLCGCSVFDAPPPAEDLLQRRQEAPELWAMADREEVQRVFRRKEVVQVGIGCQAHDVSIGEFYVQDLVQGLVAGEVARSEHAGAALCQGLVANAYQIPRKWIPGLSLRLRWTSITHGKPTWHEQYATIAQYQGLGDLWVHFYPGGDVRVIVSRSVAGQAEYPAAGYGNTPVAREPSFVDVPVEGVNLDCVVHGVVSVAPGTAIAVENPNFSNPDRGLGEANLRYLAVEHYEDADQRQLIRGCLGPTGLQLDRNWRPDHTLSVFWRRLPRPEEQSRRSKDGYVHVAQQVVVPRYDRPMPAWLHLFPNDQVRLVFSTEPPDSANHPIARGALLPMPDGPP